MANEVGISAPLIVESTSASYSSLVDRLTIHARQNTDNGWPQTWGEAAFGTPVEGIAASMKDGHLDGFLTAPNRLGEIKANQLYGGGLAPASNKFGTRTVTYVYYILDRNVSSVYGRLRAHMRVWEQAPLAVNHHNLGWLSGGYLASPPSVQWLTNDHEAGAKVSVSVTFTDPFVTDIDARHAQLMARFEWDHMDESGILPQTDGYQTAFWQWRYPDVDNDNWVFFTHRNYWSEDPEYPLFGVKRTNGAGTAPLAFLLAVFPDPDDPTPQYVFSIDTRSTYEKGVAILDASNPSVMYRTTGTSYVPTFVNGQIPTPDILGVKRGQQVTFGIKPLNMPSIGAGMIVVAKKP